MTPCQWPSTDGHRSGGRASRAEGRRSMKIKKLELFGFKSFVDKTVMKFDHDVLGIVGPNGCGKSNIVDAIRWCMGEQSAKHLRGRSMEDVLFNGSESRGPSEYAEVTLTFENDLPEELPLEFKDYAEIAVTRRLHRSGESEYLVNKEQVRLKDVTDLFLGTGVGTKAYSIVEQGKIGLIVSAKPEDRRMLIEEAAGITKFKSRKKQAERKMEQTEQNLLRVGDIVAEIERNLGTLKRQAAKAERYVSYRSELEDLQLYEATHRYLEHSGWVRRQSAEVSRVGAESDEIRTRLEQDEADFEALRLEGAEVEANLEAATSGHFAAENAVRGEEAAHARAVDRKSALVAREIAAAAERETLVTEREALLVESAELRTQLDFLEADGNGATERLQAEAARLAELQQSLSTAERLGESLRASAGKANTEIATAHAKLESFSARRAEMEDRVARLDFEAEELGARKKDLEGRLARFESELEDLKAAKAGAAEELSVADARLAQLRTSLLASEKRVESARAEAQKQRSRLGALQELAGRLDGVGAGAKSLLSAGDPALRGLVAEFVEAPSTVTTALAAVLGSRLEHVVVRDVDRGLELLEALGKAGSGRAALIPEFLPFVAGGRPLPSDADLTGVIGPLVDQVYYAPEHEGLVRSLLGDALLVQDAVVARQLRDRHGFTTVTHEGLVFDAEGSIRGGSGEAMAEGMLDTKREIRELELGVEHALGHGLAAATADAAFGVEDEAFVGD
ncbi:MAG: chromosome segregation protein SMC, partial [Proteobacteria bacterium]